MILKAKKSLGQHFLRSEKAIEQIVSAIEPKITPSPSLSKEGSSAPNNHIVFEIGPGEGVLTEALLKKGFTVVVIEIDKRSIELLENKFALEIKNKKLFIIEKDCLEVDYEKELNKISKEKNYTLVGNIPYYITGAIFRNTFEQKVLPQQVIFLVQKEVAQRIVAADKKESILSVSVKIFAPTTPSPSSGRRGISADVRIINIVKAGSFVPPPKVDSAIIAINNIRSPFALGPSPLQGEVRRGRAKQEIFFQILKSGFAHKRKYFLSNLKTDLQKDLLEKYFNRIEKIILENYSEKMRAEDISLETWHEIINFLN